MFVRYPTLVCVMVMTVACIAAAEQPLIAPEVFEQVVDGGKYAITVYRKDGTLAEMVPAKQAQAAVAAPATGVAKGGGGADLGINGFARVLFIRADFPDDRREYIDQTMAEDVCRTVSDFFKENSYGVWQPQFDVTPLLTMPHSYLHYREIVRHVSNIGGPPLLADAIDVAAAAGYSGSYDVYVVAHRPMFAASTSIIQLNGGVGALSHELGHVYGAGHSTRWLCDGIGAYTSRDWRRFGNGSPTDNGRIYNIYKTHDIPYGDPYCTMGSGSSHWSMYWKIALDLMPATNRVTATSSGRYRITAYDQPHLEAGRLYAITIPKNNQQNYLLSYRSRCYDGRSIQFAQGKHEWLPDSLLVQGTPWDSSKENNDPPDPQPHLIDTTPGTPRGLTTAIGAGQTNIGDYPDILVAPGVNPPIDGDYIQDGGIAIGRTYSDLSAEQPIHITVVGKEQSEPQALDVVVNIGSFPTNHAPTVTIRPRLSSLVGRSGQVLVPLAASATATAGIEFVATATDTDGDQLAYSWDFGDYRNPTTSYDASLPWHNTNQDSCYHYWRTADIGTAGRLVTVRCTVSDMKGGVATAFLKVNIGLPEFTGPGVGGGRTKMWAEGRVVNQAGAPLQGVRVAWIGTPYLGAWTDSDGRYALPNLADGTNHQFDATMEGWRFVGANDASGNTVVFSGRDKTQVDFVAYCRQTIAVTADSDTVAVGARPVWTVTRTLPTTGSFTKPAVYDQLTDFLNNKPLYVRIYADTTGLEWSANGGAAWTTMADFININLETPENETQYRRETQATNHTDPGNDVSPTANPTADKYIRFDAGVTSIKVRAAATTTPTAVTHYVGTYRLLAAFGIDYVAVPEEASVTVQAVLPATPTLTLRTDWGTATEDGSHIGTYTVVSDIAVASAITVPITVTPGTAGLTDIATPPTSVTLEPGAYEASFTLAAVDDRLREGPESLSVSMGAGTGYALGGTTSGALTIMADDTPRVNIAFLSGPARERNEGNTAVVVGKFCIRREGSMEQDLVVGLNVTGTATPGTDYVAIPATVTIPAGRPSVEVSVTPLSDTFTEGDETVVVTLVDRLDYQVNNPGSATMIIQDAQLPDVSVSVVGVTTISESAGSVTVRFKRWRSTTGDLTVNFSLSGTAAFGLDYTLTNMPARGQTTILAGQDHVDLVLAATNDTMREIKSTGGQDDEYVFFRVLPDPLNRYNVLYGQEDTAVTITDDDNASNGTTVGWEVPSLSVREGQPVSVDIVLADWPIQPIDTNNPDANLYARVDWAVVADTTGAHPATLGTDVPIVSGTATFIRQRNFADTERRVNVSFTIPSDALVEYDETFKLVLSNPRPTTGASRVSIQAVQNGSDNLAECLVTILDQNQGTVNLALGSTTVTEGTSVTLTVSRTVAGTSNTLPITIEMSGTAVPGVHFSQIGADAVTGGRADQLRLITLAAGENSRTITLATMDNAVDETDRVVTFTATASGYASAAPVTLTITNNDTDARQMVSVAAIDTYASESGDSATVRFTRTSTVGSLTVPYVVSRDSTASATDYGALSGTVTFSPGIAVVDLVITPVDDSVVEDTETVIIALVANSATEFQPGDPTVATVWIADNERDPAIVRVETPIPQVHEELAASGYVGRFVLRRTMEDRGPLTVTATIGGTATAGTDYVAIGVITFPAGATTVNVEVIPIDDGSAEGDELVTLTLVNGTGYEREETAYTGSVTIVDDEAASVSVTATQNGNEDGSIPVVYTLTRSGGALGTLNVDVTLSGGAMDPATPGTDTTVASVTAHFAVSATTATVSVPVVNEPIDEADETLLATVGSGTGYVAGSTPTATAIILDNDRARISLAITSAPLNTDGTYDIYEAGSTAAVLTVTSDKALFSDLIVSYSLSGTALPGADFSGGQTGSVTLTASATPSATITLTAMDDVLIEAPETIIVTLSASAGYNLDTSTTATVNVISDDGTRVAVVGPPNHLIGTFSGPLTYRFYRLGDTVGGLRVNYSVVPDADATTTDLTNNDTAFNVLSGYFDLADGESFKDLAITMKSTYVASQRRNLTIQVDTPTVLGSYVPGQVPGITGGLGRATCQILKATDTNVVKLTITDAT
ncbi:MAG: Calx-beta domain-containing protein, partial [Planctomycetota bacterium]